MAEEHAEDDLNDLMQVFDFFDVSDGEAEELESITTLKPAQSSVRQATVSPILLPKDMEVEPTPIQFRSVASLSTAADVASSDQSFNASAFPVGSSSASVNSSSAAATTVIAKQRRGRKKKEDEQVKRNMDVVSDASTVKDLTGAATGGDAEKEKERIRRESNKQSARNSRKKKKEYVIVLSESISSLTKEVQQLRVQLSQKRLQEEISEKLSLYSRNAFSEALRAYGPTSDRRRISACYQFENLTRNVAPPHTRFLLWTVSRKATETDSVASKTWQEVAGVMGLLPEQQVRLSMLLKSKKATDNAAAEERDKLQFVFGSIQKLRSIVEKKAERINRTQEMLLDILSPTQQATLHNYVESRKVANFAQQLTNTFAFRSTEAREYERIKQTLLAHKANPSQSLSQTDEIAAMDLLLSLK